MTSRFFSVMGASPAKLLFTSLLLCLTLLGSTGLPLLVEAATTGAATTQAAGVKPTAGSKDGALLLKLAEFGDKDGFELKTVRTQRTYFFTKPKNWNVLGSSAVQVTFQHSASLLPERSSLNVLVNNRILKTIPLGKDNVSKTTVSVPVPPALLKDKNTLTFQVDQHYTYQCEDPFSTELWTTLLPETALKLDYGYVGVKPELTALPYPFVDELGYGAAKMGFVAPASLSSESQTAFAMVAATLGNALEWRPAQAHLIDAGQVGSTAENLVLVGTPSENSAISGLKLPVASTGSGFSTTPDGQTVGPDDGLIQLVQHPNHKYRNILVVTGNSPKGVQKAAQFLAANPAHNILSGQYTVVKEFSQTARDAYRKWNGVIQQSGTSLYDLGFATQTSRGVTALPIFYKVKRMPDLAFAPNSKVKLTTQYSYASQLDASQSKLEVKLNGKSLGSVPLKNPAGETNAAFTIEVPSNDFFTYNDLEYQFFVYPEKMDLCKFVTDAHIWGTVHNTSKVDFSSDIRSSLPDAGLINDAGFPFTEVADMSQAAVVMPASPSASEQNTLLQLMMRLGKETPFSHGKGLVVVKPSELNGDLKSNRHLIVIGSSAVDALGSDVKGKSKYNLVKEGKTANLSETETSLATLSYNPSQGVLEEMLSPYNNKKVMLLAYGDTATGQDNVSALFAKDETFQAIGEGNLVVVNDGGQPKSVIALKRGDAQYVYDDKKAGFDMPVWGIVVLSFFALLGLFSLLTNLFSRPTRR
jgi:cellulose synthase operon protein B